ncbi:MAG: glutathione S-transferase [Pseudomonadota bacterium]
MAEYTLYAFKESGNAYKAALFLELAGCDWQARFVDFFNGETRSPDFRETVNEMGEAPVLIHGDVKLTQSGVILDYLSQQTGKFGAANDVERRDILRWTLWDNHKLTSYTATYRFLKQFVAGTDPTVLEFLRGRMIAALSVLEKHLTGRAWVATDQISTADLSICGYLFFETEFEVDWADYPAIAAWRERIKAMPGWQHPYELLPDGAG